MAQNGLDITSPASEGTFELDNAAPCILIAGYLTKRTSNMSRWRRRWWELLDDGMMLYFANEKRLKLLGEIDVARSCYDVRLGAERCLIGFPRLVPSERCFAFAVVKRTYYVYAPTAAEAKRWTELIANSSASLTRRKMSPSQSVSPPLVVRPRQPRAVRPRSAAAEANYMRTATTADQRELRDKPTELPSSQGVLFHAKADRHSSVPSSLEWVGNSPARRPVGILRSTNSPPTQGQDSSTSLSPLTQAQKAYLVQEARGKLRSKSHSRQSSYTGELEQELEEEGRALLSSTNRMSIASAMPCSQLSQEFLRLQEREVEIRKQLALMEELPPRPNSVDTRWANLPSSKRGRSSSAGVINLPVPQRHNLADSHHRADSPAESGPRAASGSSEKLGRHGRFASASQVSFTDGSSQEDLETKKGKSRSLPRGTPTLSSSLSDCLLEEESQEQQSKCGLSPGDHRVQQNENGESHV